MRYEPYSARAATRTAAETAEAFETPARSAPGDRAAFLLEFLRHPRQIGSVVPSSSFLEQRLVRATDAANARTIVELGPGTGGTTRALLRALRADAHLLAIDLSPSFCARLAERVRDPRLAIQRGSAEHIEDYLRQWRLPRADAIVSGIPFSTMPPEVADRIARAIAAALAPGGHFVAYQVRADVARYASRYLGTPLKRWEWRNVPPLQVFTWTRLKASAATGSPA
jgi:phospholipid N-methyltransferase